MKLILEAIKALFRKAECNISASAAALTKKITKAQNTADAAGQRASTAVKSAKNAQTTADNAMTTASNAQTVANEAKASALRFHSMDGMGGLVLKPTKTEQLSVGEETSISEIDGRLIDIMDNGRAGDTMSMYVRYYKDNGQSATTLILLTKTGPVDLRGGAWANSGLASPHYYDVRVSVNTISSYIRRLI